MILYVDSLLVLKKESTCKLPKSNNGLSVEIGLGFSPKNLKYVLS